MATSTISNGKILQAKQTGEPLPASTVLTADGEPTTDAGKAEILLPLGGPKGSGLGLMFEMLTSILAAAPIQARALGPEQRKRHVANLAMLAIDISRLPSARRFHQRRRHAHRHSQSAAAAGGL